VLGELEAVGLAEGGVGGDREGLQVALAGGLDAQLAIVVLQPGGGSFQLRAAGAAATKFRRGQELDVVEIEIGIDGGGGGERDGGKDEARKEPAGTDFHVGLLPGLLFLSGRRRPLRKSKPGSR